MHGSATIEVIDPSGDAQNPQPPRRWMRWLRVLLVMMTLGGFGALVGTVYYETTRDGLSADGQIPLVRADPAPFRSRPDNPGGVEVAHQNVEVYDRVGQPAAPAQPGQAGRPVERLLPPPEAPLPRPLPAPPPVVGGPAAAAPVPASPSGPAASPGAAPTSPAQAGNAPPAQTLEPGRIRVQVGALPTQEAAAREAERLRRVYGGLFGRVGITVVRGEGGGSIYRVHAGPLRDRAAADELCSALRQHRVGCIIVNR